MLQNRSKSVLCVVYVTVMISICMARPARAAFHLWALQEIYTNSSGTLQFIEMVDQFGGQEFFGGQQIVVSNAGNTQQHTFTIPNSFDQDSFDHTLLFATSGVQVAGGPKPDFVLPNGFLFAAGGTINFFGMNSGSYSALPTDGNLSRVWGGDSNDVNSPENFDGQSGHVVVPVDTRGDFNQDGHVNSSDIQPMLTALTDLNAYKTAHGLTSTTLLPIADVDQNGVVNNLDAQALLTKLKSGGGSGSSAFATVPEPGTLLLAAMAAIGVFAPRLRKCANHWCA
jgi:hypothetical protein